MPSLTPNEAATKTGRSRRTIMRAIETLELTARRDNRNRWQIDEGDLAQWARNEHAQTAAQSENHPSADVLQERIRGLEELVSELRQAGADMRSDRDHWRSMAQRGLWSRLFSRAA